MKIILYACTFLSYVFVFDFDFIFILILAHVRGLSEEDQTGFLVQQ